MRILFKLATRSRPDKFFACLQNIIENLADRENYQILVSYDFDDDGTHRIIYGANAYRNIVFDYNNIRTIQGDSKNKIHAVNRDIEKVTDWDILINTSDDMLFTQHGFDDIIRKDMADNFPDLDGFLHYNDGNQKSNVCTMSIMGRKYYERFNYIYHPDYKSVWCDVEATEVAYMLGKYKYKGDDKILFKHLHPAWGLAEYDEQYRKSENLDVWGEDLQILLERKARHYDLNPKEIITNYKYPPSEMIKWQSELNNARQNKGMQPIEF